MPFNERYFSFSYSIGLIQVLKNRWKIVGILRTTLASDFHNEINGHDWSHIGVFPAYMASHYTYKRLDIGVKMSDFGNVYNSTTEIQSNLELDKLGYSRINIGPDFKFCIYKSLYAAINTGITVRNRLFSMDSQRELEMELTVKPKFFFNFGLSILM